MKTGGTNVQRVVLLHLKGHVYLYMGSQRANNYAPDNKKYINNIKRYLFFYTV